MPVLLHVFVLKMDIVFLKDLSVLHVAREEKAWLKAAFTHFYQHLSLSIPLSNEGMLMGHCI